MNYSEFESLTSEISMLEKLLKDIPQENIFDRFSVEKRLEKARKKLDNTNPYHISKKARLTFRGPHVIGSEAINALFASEATVLFSKAISTISATLNGNINKRGKVPNCDDYQLMITGMATGSLGFEFDLPIPDPNDLFSSRPTVELALEEISKLFDVSVRGDDEALSDIVTIINPRAVKAVFNFLKFLQDKSSLCGFEFDNKFFRFKDQDQLSKVINRLDSNNIHESVVVYKGEFQGVLPGSKTFEFKCYNDNNLIKGKFGKNIQDPDIINREWLHKPINVHIIVTQVGDSKPKYVVDSLDQIHLIKE